VVVDSAKGQERCTRRSARIASRNAKSLSSPKTTGRYTARTVFQNANKAVKNQSYLKKFSVAVIGAGAAGCMAAARAGQLNAGVVLIEKNPSIGVKLLLTGAGRCNLTNTASIDAFIEKFGKQGNFYRTAFYRFSSEALKGFFGSFGLALKDERQGRVFPSSDRAASVIETLLKALAASKTEILYKMAVLDIKRKNDAFELALNEGDKVFSKKVILATGGLSYPQTGSTGDGYRIAKKLGHTIVPLKAALVPLKTKERWVRDLQGISLENIRVTFLAGAKNIVSPVGELMFAHFGVSGPLVLDLSGDIVGLLSERKEVKLFIDLKPGLDAAKLEARLLRDFKAKGASQLATIMEELVPKRMALVLMRLAGLEPAEKANQVTQEQRRAIIGVLKTLPLTIEGPLAIKDAMVTNGGVSTKEINPRTMESKIIPGLYFAGELIDGAAPSGGYNLQQAFSTGFLAGEEAAKCAG
jgi:predicted Rossmann fold flavoprotein